MIYALIVIYNKSCKNSSSINDIQKYAPDIKLIIYDNSIKNFRNRSFCEEKGYTYFTQQKNVGISRAYNFVLNNMPFKENDYLIMLDDDTHLNHEYLDEVKKIIKMHKYDVILPIVRANNKIISPYNYHMTCRSKMVDDPASLILSKVSGINSGMVIRTSLFNKVRYNERLFLDYVDYDFMKRVHDVNGIIYIMHSQINQEFQYFNYDSSNINGALFRFKIDMHDYKELCDEVGESWFFYIHSTKFMLKQTIRYKSPKFCVELLKFWVVRR